MARISRERMRGVLGEAPKPAAVWQKQFDGDDETLQRLARLDWDEIPEQDLWAYIHDLTYVELQPDLFRHVFPRCLKFWYETLLRNESAERGDADFHRALIVGAIADKMMSPEERKRLFAFFVDGMLDRIDAERDFAYERPGAASQAWIGRFNALGIVAPVIPEIWTSWWALASCGQAIAAIRYASGLVYLKGENPIYLPWTPAEGGGGPYLTESDASIFDEAWLASNLSFLSGTLTSDYVVERVAAAAAALSGSPEEEMARRVAEDAKARTDVVTLRIDDLVANLARTKLAQERWD